MVHTRCHGRFHLSCADTISLSWLQSSIGSITVPGDGGTVLQLELLLPSQLPRRFWAEVYVSGPSLGIAHFLRFIQMQNSGLNGLVDTSPLAVNSSWTF